MKPQYITLVGTTPKIVPLDTNVVSFEVSIRPPAGVTVELALEHPSDSLSDAGRVAVGPAPTWVAAPAAGANGVISLFGTPYAAVRLTPTTGGQATILQQGLR